MTAAIQTDPLLAAFDRLVTDAADRILIAGCRQATSVAKIDALARTLADSVLDPTPTTSRRIGVLAPNGPGFLAALLACRRRGRVPVLLDPAMPVSERARVAKVLGFTEVLRIRTGFPELSTDVAVERYVSQGPTPPPLDGEALIKLTSGSSGEPRGVAVGSAALLADDQALRETMGIRSSDRLLAAIPFSHSYGLSSLVIPALVAGVQLILPEETTPLAPLHAADRFQATVFPTVPAWATALTRLGTPPALPHALRLVIVAGAPVSPENARAFRDRCGLPLHAFYGTSETGGIAYDPTGTAAAQGDVGEPVRGVQVALEPGPLTAQEADPTARIRVRSPAVAIGYTPIASARLAGGQFLSNDLGCWNGTRLRLIGRADALINVRGLKVQPAEVEGVIRELGPVTDVVVEGLDGAHDGDRVVCAFVACPPGTLTTDEVVARCRGRLSDYKIPRRVVLVSEIPRTARGKVDRAALQRLGTHASADA